ncbi:hypothetical protein PHIN3_260 [Sinorhizobium phage phiN3]|uniref:Uncharacterized protein n=1 Tax=Sinorhizobium phage phiN3 TaxID=1647405 RepID=A0A0F6SJ37_9CAUD|nr:hypothetical protein AVT40_gp273 [Sinorhizobium phage phiN3]AKF13523.1 hypothetical protein PHIN3_260 [Sinorhizobium phage phiN3]
MMKGAAVLFLHGDQHRLDAKFGARLSEPVNVGILHGDMDFVSIGRYVRIVKYTGNTTGTSHNEMATFALASMNGRGTK